MRFPRRRLFIKENEQGVKLEPMEIAYIDVPEDATGSVIQKLTQRRVP